MTARKRQPAPKETRVKTSFRLSSATRDRLAALAAHWETSQAGALERAVRETAKRERVE